MATLIWSIATLGARAIDAFWPAVDRRAPLAVVDSMPPPATAAAPAAAPPLVLDAHADTLDHVVRAVARSGFLPQAVRLMLASPEHLHDPELLYRTRGVRGAGGTTLLMRAVERCDEARATEIVGACSTPAARVELLASVDDVNWTVLHTACSPIREDEEMALRLVELLLGAGADLRASSGDYEYYQPIHVAAKWSVRLVQRLVQAGASIDGDAEYESTLCAAACAGSAQGVRMIPALVALGARKTLDNHAMRYLACWHAAGAPQSNEEVRAALTALVSVGCSLTAPDEDDGQTPMDTAASSNNTPVVTALLAMGVAGTAQSLVNAVMHPNIVRVLLAAGAPPGGLVRLAAWLPNETPLMAAAKASVLESVRLLLRAGASVNRQNARGHTALMFAFQSGSLDADAVPRVVDALLDVGASVAIRDNAGNTPLQLLALHHATKPWAAAVARLLLASGAVARSYVNQRTPADCVPGGLARAGPLYALLLAEEEA